MDEYPLQKARREFYRWGCRKRRKGSLRFAVENSKFLKATTNTPAYRDFNTLLTALLESLVLGIECREISFCLKQAWKSQYTSYSEQSLTVQELTSSPYSEKALVRFSFTQEHADARRGLRKLWDNLSCPGLLARHYHGIEVTNEFPK